MVFYKYVKCNDSHRKIAFHSEYKRSRNQIKQISKEKEKSECYDRMVFIRREIHDKRKQLFSLRSYLSFYCSLLFLSNETIKALIKDKQSFIRY